MIAWLHSFLHGVGVVVSAPEPRLPLTTNLVMERSAAPACVETKQWAPTGAGARSSGRRGDLVAVAPGNVGAAGQREISPGLFQTPENSILGKKPGLGWYPAPGV